RVDVAYGRTWGDAKHTWEEIHAETSPHVESAVDYPTSRNEHNVSAQNPSMILTERLIHLRSSQRKRAPSPPPPPLNHHLNTRRRRMKSLRRTDVGTLPDSKNEIPIRAVKTKARGMAKM